MRLMVKIALFVVLALALTACGGGDSGGGNAQGGGTTITVTGGTEFTITTPGVYGVEAIDDETTVRQFFFTTGEEQVVVIMFYNLEPAAGEYTIESSMDFTVPRVDVLVLSRAGDTMKSFALESQGTLTLTESNGTFGGTFAFTSKGGDLMATEEQIETVTVNGTFSGISKTE